MKVVVSAQGQDLDSDISPVFGRCPTLVFVDTETWEAEALPNPAMSESGGAGIQAAQFVVNQGAKAVITGNLGPNAFEVLQAAGVPGYLVSAGTVRQAVRAFQAGELALMQGASVAAHAGTGTRRTAATARPQAAAAQTPTRRATELAELREALKSLRQQLAETMTRIEKLEKEAKEA